MFTESEPTRGGLYVLQAYFHNLEFPLPDFRVNVAKGARALGAPVIYRSYQGHSENLDALAAEDPFTPIVNVALLSGDHRYGLFFVQEWALLPAPYPLLASTNEIALGMLMPATEIPQVVTRMKVYDEDETHKTFAAWVTQQHEPLCCLAHYGRINPSLLEMIRFFLRSKKYHFGPPAAPSLAA